ncbi:MAG: RsmD family RNA methyltransferase [Bacteroidales bacterium]|nr:RsmD family RNA methyltransferase [Bacteroidales bacterium]
MRIISGKNKGRKIIAPGNLPVRPTTDMAKESLFNILNNHVNYEDLNVLDLFAGTGNISYEFVSRGSKSITAVDNNPECTGFINQTAKKLNYDNLYVIRSDYRIFLKHTHNKWDLVFADPPYNMEDIEEIIFLVFEKDILNKNGWLIIEHSRNIDFSDYRGYFDHRVYGKVNFSFFRKKH